MRRTMLVFFLLCFPVYSIIHVNQIGYYPKAPKIITIPDTGIKSIKILESNSKIITDVPPVIHSGYYDGSNENVVSFDFSKFSCPGIYKIISGSDTSAAFTIADSIYNNALKTIVKSFYYQRCSFALDKKYAGQWYRAAGHPDTSLSLLEVATTSVTKKSVQGGWYDAGDFGKYVVCAGITCGNMLGSYELCPELLGDGSLNIPESQNNQNDLLDEIKYELDWLITMQDEDGGVFFKVGPVSWPNNIMPANDKTKRYIIGKSTTSTLNFAAVMAMAGRIYVKYDSAFAKDCRERAESAWIWAQQNPRVANPENTEGTGPYADGSDKTYSDEFFWALSELYITTGKDVYKDGLFSMIKNKKITSYAWWQDVKNLGFFSLSVHSDILPDSIKSLVNGTIISSADAMVKDIGSCPYLIPMKKDNYYWGSNSSIGNMAIVLVYAYNVNQNSSYLENLIYTTDYIFGRNPTGYSYVTGLGSHPPMFPGHRQCFADGIDDPVPGFVVGGPNQGLDDGADPLLVEIIEAGTAPAKCYIDSTNSWASNEVSINQSSAWVPVLSFLEKNISNLNCSRTVSHFKKMNGIIDFKYISQVKGFMVEGLSTATTAEVSVYDINGRCLIKKNMTGRSVLPLKKNSGSMIVKIKSGSYSMSRLIQCVK